MLYSMPGHQNALQHARGLVGVDALLDLRPEVADQPLPRIHFVLGGLEFGV